MDRPSRARSRDVEPGLAARALRPLVSGLQVLHHDSARIFAAAGLKDAAPVDPDTRVPTSAVMTLWDEAVRLTGDLELGLHIAEHAEIDSFDVTLYAMLASPTLGEAYARMSRYQRLIHDTTSIVLAREGSRATLRHALPGGLAVPRRPRSSSSRSGSGPGAS